MEREAPAFARALMTRKNTRMVCDRLERRDEQGAEQLDGGDTRERKGKRYADRQADEDRGARD